MNTKGVWNTPLEELSDWQLDRSLTEIDRELKGGIGGIPVGPDTRKAFLRKRGEIRAEFQTRKVYPFN